MNSHHPGRPSAAPRQPPTFEIPLKNSEEEDGWLTTYLDTITLLLVMFVVMLALSGGPSDTPGGHSAQTSPGAQGSSTTAGLLSQDRGPAAISMGRPEPGLQTRQPQPQPAVDDTLLNGLGDDIEVIREAGRIRFRISSEILFPSGGAGLQDSGYLALDPLIPVLMANDLHITVAGHTDDIPISNSIYPSNWELSSARAGSVIRYLVETGIRAQRLTAVGYAATRPLQSNASSRGRAANRRVEISLGSSEDNGGRQ